MGFWHVYLGIYGGGGDAEATEPTDGWVARSSSRTVSGGLNRVVAAPEMNRVVVAYVERR